VSREDSLGRTVVEAVEADDGMEIPVDILVIVVAIVVCSVLSLSLSSIQQ